MKRKISSAKYHTMESAPPYKKSEKGFELSKKFKDRYGKPIRDVMGEGAEDLLETLLENVESGHAHPKEIVYSKLSDETWYLHILIENNDSATYNILVKYHPRRRATSFLHASPYPRESSNSRDPESEKKVDLEIDGRFYQWLGTQERIKHAFPMKK